MNEFTILQRHTGIRLAADPCDYRVLNYGGGVQSSALLHMAMRGEYPDRTPFPRVDLVIHADTGDELPETVEHVERQLERADEAGLAVAHVSAGNIYDDTMEACMQDEAKGRKRFSTIPMHTHSQEGNPILMRRQCTNDYKLRPMKLEIRRRLGYKPRQRMKHSVTCLLGITLDEAQRINGARDTWQSLSYPLCESGMTRADTVSYLRAIGEEVCLRNRRASSAPSIAPSTGRGYGGTTPICSSELPNWDAVARESERLWIVPCICTRIGFRSPRSPLK